MSLAFSYVRFSSERQGEGTSYARQIKLAEDYAAQNSLTLDPRKFDDLGVSAYKGTNVSEGALGRFLTLVDQGQIPKGSYLLVESLDRISRASISEALPLFMSIVNRGINVVTLADRPPQVYTKQKIDADSGMSLFGSMMVLLRAHNESAEKGRRVKSAYDIKRRRGDVITSKGPAWLRLDAKSKKWVVIPDKARVVNRIFDMAIAGHGQVQIVRTLDAERVPTMLTAKHWTQSVVGAILRNPAVYGVFEQKSGGREVRENYYEPIMDKDKFMLARSAVSLRHGKGGIRKTVTNLFSGLCYCKDCGSRMRFVPTRTDNAYLHCLTAYSSRTRCAARPIPYKAAELAFIQIIEKEWDPKGKYTKIELLQKAADDRLNKRIALKTEQDRVKEKQSSLVRLATLAPNVEAVATELQLLQRRIEEIDKELTALAAPPLTSGDIEAGHAAFERYHALKSAGDVDTLNDLRRSMKVMIARQIERVSFGYVGSKNISIPDGADPSEEPFMELRMRPPWVGPRGGQTRTFAFGRFLSPVGIGVRRARKLKSAPATE
jgi:DNA invertase Pin-like site-specific DNA recombinase